jgi:outer membrane lipoprotein-sorting protein
MRALLALAITTTVAHAQPSKLTPANALAKVEATYKKPASLTAAFDQTNTYDATGITNTAKGTITVSKPDKMRFDYVDKKNKPHREMIFDGKTLWIVEHKNLQVIKHTANTSQMPGAIAFFLGAGSLSKDFNVSAPNTTKHVVPGAVMLMLTPKQPNASYKEIHLAIDPSTWTVKRTTLINSSNDTTTYEFKQVNTTAKVDPAKFVFDPKSQPTYKVVTPPPSKTP